MTLSIPRRLQTSSVASTASASYGGGTSFPDELDPLLQRLKAVEGESSWPLPAEAMRGGRRIAANDLMGHEFMRRFFIGSATLSDAQSLVQRLQTVIKLIDKEETGYIRWSEFTDLIISISPQYLLRSNVIAFLEAQADVPSSFIDYNEFIITGKVLILDEFWYVQ
jgi:hypothetical protein